MAIVPIETKRIEVHVDSDGRRFEYVHLQHPESRGLGIHFSAFFGAWGERKEFQEFRGYFHRMKMLGSDLSRDWLFLCDPYGAFDNGTYYTGRQGDLFVERATRAIIAEVLERRSYRDEGVVMIGSSMGGTAAIKFGIEFASTGVVAIGPHIDLDICATEQNRMEEVAWICPDGDPLSPANQYLTRQIRQAISEAKCSSLPTLFVQASKDDNGVYDEQIVPLVASWKDNGSVVETDIRATGGHTSDFAPRAVLIDAVGRILDGEPLEPERYALERAFRPETKALSIRVTNSLRSVKRWAGNRS